MACNFVLFKDKISLWAGCNSLWDKSTFSPNLLCSDIPLHCVSSIIFGQVHISCYQSMSLKWLTVVDYYMIAMLVWVVLSLVFCLLYFVWSVTHWVAASQPLWVLKLFLIGASFAFSTTQRAEVGLPAIQIDWKRILPKSNWLDQPLPSYTLLEKLCQHSWQYPGMPFNSVTGLWS